MKHTFTLLGIAGALLLSATACKSEKEQKTDNPALREVSIAEEEVPAESLNSPFRTRKIQISLGKDIYKLEVDYPQSGRANVVESIRRDLYSRFSIKNADLEKPDAAFQKKANDFMNEYRQAQAEAASDDFEMPAWSYEGEVEVEYNTQQYITYEWEDYIYMGGAHGMPQHFSFSFDAQTGKPLKWEDFFVQGCWAKLKPIVKQGLIAQSGYEEVDPSTWPLVQPTLAPAFTPKGIAFYYEAYEIACFAAGIPSCVIPYSRLQPYMTDYAKSIAVAQAGKGK